MQRSKLATFAGTIAAVALWAGAADADMAGSACTGGAPETSKVVVMADWLPWADQAPFFQAINDGTYERAGLEVEVRSPPNPADPLKLAAVRRVNYSFTYVPEIMIAMETMVPVVSIAALIHNASEGYVHDPGIQSVADLKGKKIAYINNATGKAILDTVLGSGRPQARGRRRHPRRLRRAEAVRDGQGRRLPRHLLGVDGGGQPPVQGSRQAGGEDLQVQRPWGAALPVHHHRRQSRLDEGQPQHHLRLHGGHADGPGRRP